MIERGVKYRISGETTAVCVGFAKQQKENLEIPDEISYRKSDYRIKQIAPKAFYKNKKLKIITIGRNTEKIGKSAFEQCSSLKKVVFGRKVKVIKEKVFYKDHSITCLDFRGGRLKTVEANAFSRGRQKKKVFVPRGVSKRKYYMLLQGSIKE